jgi:putative PIN family toxin of toxin-antitoxin system
MLIVCDTNVLVSALLNPFGSPASFLGLILEGKVTTALDARIFAEYREVLGRARFGFRPEAVSALMAFIEESGEFVNPLPCPFHLKDPDDAPFLEVAVSAGAEYLVTGNLGHFPSKSGRVRIVSPSEFIKMYLARQEKR